MHPVVAALCDLVAPERCVGCGAAGDVCCPACLASMPWTPAVRCARCGMGTPVATDRCPDCPPGIAWGRQACAYAPTSRALVTALKDDGRRAAAAVMAAAIVVRCAPPAPGCVLVPVPPGPRRRRRGGDHAGLLARRLALLWGVPACAALRRTHDAPAQRGASRDARRRQVAGAFGAAGAVPAHACLVDDVVTTGATLSACAHALRRAGCRRVEAVAFARTPRDSAIGLP